MTTSKSQDLERLAREWCAGDSAISLQRSADYISWLDNPVGEKPNVPFEDRANSLAQLLTQVCQEARDSALEDAILDLQKWCKHNSPQFQDQVLVMHTAIDHLRALKTRRARKGEP